MIRRILSSLGVLLGFIAWGEPVGAQEAAEEAGAGAAAGGGLTLGSALVALGTLVIVLGGVLLYLAIERRRA